MNNFKYRPYTEKMINIRSTPIEIPLESHTELSDPRLEKLQKKKRINSEKVPDANTQKKLKKCLDEDHMVSTEIRAFSTPIEAKSLTERMKDIATEIAKEINCEIPTPSHLKTRGIQTENQVDPINLMNNVQGEKEGRSILILPENLNENNRTSASQKYQKSMPLASPM